jgi:polyisoprenoid-binding protein YceI
VAKRLLLLLAVVALIGVIGGPWIYGEYLEGAPDPVLKLPSERHPATTDINGVWVVTAGPGEESKRSQVGYRADQQLLWKTVTVDGRTNDVSGRAIITGTTLQSADFVVDVASMRSSHHGRDDRFRSADVMAAEKLPTAQLKVSEAVDLSGIPASGAPVSVEVPAELTLKGASRQVAVQLDVQRSGDRVYAVGQIQVVLADYTVSPPVPFGGLLAVQPIVTIEFLLTLVRQ